MALTRQHNTYSDNKRGYSTSTTEKNANAQPPTMPTISLMNEAFALLGVANDLEKKSKELQPSHSPSPSVLLQESAAKYHDACYLMKRHIRGSVQSSSGSISNSEKQLLAGKIDHYEMHADQLLKKVEGLKLTEQQQQQQQHQHQTINREKTNGDNSERNNINATNRMSLKNASGSLSWETTHSKNEMEATQAEGKASRSLDTAINHDERGETIEALQQYLHAAELYLHAVTLLASSDRVEAGGGQASSESSILSKAHKVRVESLNRKRKLTLDRVRELKCRIRNSDSTEPSPPPKEPSAPKPTKTKQTPHHDGNIIQPDKLTPYEIKVLSWSSKIASGVFLPWSDDEAKTYNYSPTQSWKDPDGLLPLSDKQQGKFYKWARPSEIITMRHKPCKIAMINSITPYTIKQHCVSDCSFIAGLCISAAFERRFNRRLVSSLIYPQDPKTCMPIYNPKGVYMVKLWLNGVERRVLVDDLLPVDEKGKLLCSHTTCLSSKSNSVLELWVPILEKAYMKLCGGYDFPGSNSGVDLFCLTGWIPERIFFPKDPTKVKDFETPVERAWDRLYSANSYGDCLITVSTSKELTEEQAEEVGLVTGHAYAVLGVALTSNGTRLLQLKNPWASKGWKGRFSSQDKESWKDKSFCDEVGYDAASASQHDDGVFWMPWEDILLYFRNIHMSWSRDPALFQFRTAVHGYWAKDMGPSNDSYNVGENPQYTVTLSEKAIKSKATVWLLLSRHVTKQEQEGGKVTDYLSLHIHQIKHRKQRVWYPNSNCVLTGPYTNNQHVLVCYDASGPEDRFLSIVLSQYKKSNDLGYTLSCFCTEKFELGHPEQSLPKCLQLIGSWKLRDNSTDQSHSLAIGTAGGSPGKGSFGSNPQWSVRVPARGARIQVKCMAPKDLAINVILTSMHQNESQHGDSNKGQVGTQTQSTRIHHLYEDPIIDTYDYRRGFAVSEARFVPAGLYTLVASCWDVGQVGNFLLDVLSSKNVHISQIG